MDVANRCRIFRKCLYIAARCRTRCAVRGIVNWNGEEVVPWGALALDWRLFMCTSGVVYTKILKQSSA